MVLVKGEHRGGGLLCVLLVQLPSRYIMCVRELTGGAESAVSREGHRGDLQVSWLSAHGGARGAHQLGTGVPEAVDYLSEESLLL